MDRLHKTSRYFLEHLVPRDALDTAQEDRLKAILSEDDDMNMRGYARELAEVLAERGLFQRVGEFQYLDPKSGARFRFPSAAAAASVAGPTEEVAHPRPKPGRALLPPQSEQLEEIYDEVLSAIRLEERSPGAESGLGRLLSLLDRWVSNVAYQLYCFHSGSEIPDQFADQILVIEPATLDISHPFRQVIQRKVALQLLADDVSFMNFPKRPEGKKGGVYLLPLFLDGKPWGVLDILLPKDEADEKLEGKLQLLASALSHQIYNHRILSKVVFVDWTTQIYNRTFLEIQLPVEIEKAQRNKEHLALLVLDLDDFKKVNDQWGHAQGDQVLREFAQVLKKTFRKVDQIFRFGGEEFVVLLPRLNRERAIKAAERVAEAIRHNTFLADETPSGIKLTASIGGAIFPDMAASDAQLFRKADESCYRAKDEGKDRVVFPDTE